MIDHPPHIEHAKRALEKFDRARTGSELSRAAVKAANALRVLLREPADGFQDDDTELEQRLRRARIMQHQ